MASLIQMGLSWAERRAHLISKAMHSGQKKAAQKRRGPRKDQTMAQLIQMERKKDQTRVGLTEMDSS